MKTFNSGKCPVCSNKLNINRLSCPHCNAEYPINTPLSPYDYLSDEQLIFLEVFLKCRGNVKSVCDVLGKSYPTVKKQLDELLSALNLYEDNSEKVIIVDMSNFVPVDDKSVKASEIIRKKLFDCDGQVTITLLDGKSCNIVASSDGLSFTTDKIRNYTLAYEFSVFDVITDLLIKQGGKAPKGNAHGKEDKVGQGKCTEDTIVGAIAINYFGKAYGESTYDPVFVLSAILEWAGIAHNCRGYIEITASYKALLADRR